MIEPITVCEEPTIDQLSTIKALDKLREWANVKWEPWAESRERLHRMLDEIESEIEERYMPLPLDADGVPIRVGDVMVDYKTPRNVVAVAPDSFMMDGYEIDSFYRPGLAKNHRHAKRTLEDVLFEFGEAFEGEMDEIAPVIAKYAEEIRELMGVEE